MGILKRIKDVVCANPDLSWEQMSLLCDELEERKLHSKVKPITSFQWRYKMAKLFRISGYLVDTKDAESVSSLVKNLFNEKYNGLQQQLHIEKSEHFTLDGEDTKNCDLALLARHFKKDVSDSEFDSPIPEKGEQYKHFKLGKIVTIVSVSRHTETEEVSVVYECAGEMWNRPFTMFMSEVNHEQYPDATQKYRFEREQREPVNQSRLKEFRVFGNTEVENCAVILPVNGNQIRGNTVEVIGHRNLVGLIT